MRKFEKVSYKNTGILPTRSDTRSAGYAIYSTEDKWIYPNSVEKFTTNIKVYMEPDEVLMIYPRSSVGIKMNLMLANTTGVIDSSYVDNKDNEGNIIVALFNYGNKPQQIKAGERIAQGVFMKYLITDDDNTKNTERSGGIGSSGR